MTSFRRVFLPVLLLALLSLAGARQLPANQSNDMRWRLIGPFRGGRALAVAGVPGQPEVAYFGAVGGGVWKTTDGGRVWRPIFDHEPVASIGAIAVAPSDPNIIYVGTGEADMRSDISAGGGMYKSTDGGATWQFLGLAATRQIAAILVDPHDPDRVYVAALGHAYGPNPERGVYRSLNGGRTWQKVLYKNSETGAASLAFDPDNPHVLYATLWQARRTPWSQYPPDEGPGSGLYRSNDGGDTWKQISGHGLPSGNLGRIGLALGAHGRRIYALIAAQKPAASGLYRSDDAGQSWHLVSTDPRITSRQWYFSGITVDSTNDNIVYVADVALYRSSDGGRTFSALKGAPGGDDYHTLWINPLHPRHMVLASDQGTVMSHDGGRTWSSWYNQPTAQFYHVVTDHRFPYWVYGAQQDSGTAAVVSRSDYGEISFRDWHPVGGGESGYIAPDPHNPGIVYAGGTYGDLTRYDHRTGQVQNIRPAPLATFGANPATMQYRFTWTSPLVFSPIDRKTLYFGAQVLLQTRDGGHSWQQISPDLTVLPGETDPDPKAPLSAANARARKRGVIYTIAPSPVAAGEIWAGTDDGLIQLTRDGGKHWQNVTPPGLSAWSKISLIEASPFDAGTAYAAVDRHRLDDIRPYLYRTHDFGKTWQLITQGIPEHAYVHAVREDPERKGLLYAGTEFGVCVSFDDGDHWQSLQLNLPTAPVRDLAIEQGDLIAATHGRSFWILDDLAPLRQMNAQTARAGVWLFRPRMATRIRRTENQDTPLPLETPVGTNPPTGAILDYQLAALPHQPVELQILDAHGAVLRRFRSDAKPAPLDTKAPFPTVWLQPEEVLPAHVGLNRFVWDLRTATPAALGFGYGMGAIIGGGTDRLPQGPLVLPGTYQVRLIVNGKSYTQPLTVRQDPRVSTSSAALTAQWRLEQQIMQAMQQSRGTYAQAQGMLQQLQKKPANAALVNRVKMVMAALAKANGDLSTLLIVVDSADAAPTQQAQTAFTGARNNLQKTLQSWQQLRRTELSTLPARPVTPDIKPVMIEESY